MENPILFDTGKGLSVEYCGRSLYSRRDPQRAALSLLAAEEMNARESVLVVAFSPLLGYGLKELLRSLPDNCAVLCVEADQALMALSLERIDPEILQDKRIKFIRTESPEAAASYALSMGRFRKTVELRLSGGYLLNRKTYSRILEAIDRDIANLWMNKATLSAMGALWAKNIFSNIKAASLTTRLPLPKTKKAIFVLGAGPSAEAALAWIAERRDRLYLVAVDTALPFLNALSLKADIVICLEAQAHNLKDFIGSCGSGIGLIADLVSHPRAFLGLGGGVHPILSLLTESRFLERVASCGIPMTKIPPLGSVGVAAAWLAPRFGEGPIFLSGLDFSFERGKPHARGAPSSLQALASWSRTQAPLLYSSSMRKSVFLKEDIHGRLVSTDPVMRNYAELFRKDISSTAQYLDLRGGGLDLGIKSLNLSEADEVLDAWAKKSVDEGSSAQPIVTTLATEETPSSIRREGCASPRSEAGAQAAKRFLAEEEERLSRIYALLKGESRREDVNLMELLLESDYLYWKFLDRSELPTTEQSFLNRILVETIYWKMRIGRLL